MPARRPVHNQKTFEEYFRIATLEDNGDEVLYFRQYGESPTLTSDVSETVWTNGGNITVPFVSSTIDVVSTSAQDASGGTGAAVLQIKGLDTDYNLVSEIIVLNGTTPVTTTTTFVRPPHQLVAIPGPATGLNNTGTINLTATTGGSDMGQILPTVSLSQTSFFTVPAGYTAFITQIILGCYRVSGTAPHYGAITFEQYVNSIGAVIAPVRASVSSVTPSVFPKPMPLVLNEKDSIWTSGVVDKSGARLDIQYEMILLKGNWDQHSLI